MEEIKNSVGGGSKKVLNKAVVMMEETTRASRGRVRVEEWLRRVRGSVSRRSRGLS